MSLSLRQSHSIYNGVHYRIWISWTTIALSCTPENFWGGLKAHHRSWLVVGRSCLPSCSITTVCSMHVSLCLTSAHHLTVVLTKPRDRDGVTKYIVYRRPIPLDLLALTSFNDAPVPRTGGLLTRNTMSSLYPFTVQHNGRQSTPITLYVETAQARSDWKQKLEEAKGLRAVVSESNKVFEIETLSIETFLVPPVNLTTTNTPSWHDVGSYTGRVTCSVPFSKFTGSAPLEYIAESYSLATADGRGLVAIGCSEGVWIGFRHDSRSMRRVLHVRMVSQCAMLEDFGLFLVLADKVSLGRSIQPAAENDGSYRTYLHTILKLLFPILSIHNRSRHRHLRRSMARRRCNSSVLERFTAGLW